MNNLILIGMMGCGKSTVGRLAAEKLGLAFVDTDERIERASGRTIPEIFASEGEEGFRARELDVSRALAREGGLVIACGGGLPTRAEAIAAPPSGPGGKRGVSGAVPPAGAHLPPVGGLHHRGPYPGRRGGRAHRGPL